MLQWLNALAAPLVGCARRLPSPHSRRLAGGEALLVGCSAGHVAGGQRLARHAAVQAVCAPHGSPSQASLNEGGSARAAPATWQQAERIEWPALSPVACCVTVPRSSHQAAPFQAPASHSLINGSALQAVKIALLGIGQGVAGVGGQQLAALGRRIARLRCQARALVACRAVRCSPRTYIASHRVHQGWLRLPFLIVQGGQWEPTPTGVGVLWSTTPPTSSKVGLVTRGKFSHGHATGIVSPPALGGDTHTLPMVTLRDWATKMVVGLQAGARGEKSLVAELRSGDGWSGQRVSAGLPATPLKAGHLAAKRKPLPA